MPSCRTCHAGTTSLASRLRRPNESRLRSTNSPRPFDPGQNSTFTALVNPTMQQTQLALNATDPVKAGEFGADLGGVGVVHFVEDGQGLLPGVAGGLRVAGGVVGVAEVGEGVGLVVAVAGVPDQSEGVLVAGDGLGVLAEVVVGVAQAVPGG